MKRLLPVLLLLIAAGAYFAWTRFKAVDDNILLLSGNIEFRKIDIAFKTAGKLAELNVEEGADVKSGQILGRLDREQITRVRLRDSSSVDVAQSNLLQLQTAIQYQKTTLESELKLRDAELRQAKAKLQELLDGARPQEVAQVRAQRSDLTVARDQALRDLDRAQKLIAKEDISQSQFDQYKARLDSVTAQLQSVDQRLALVIEGPRKTDIETARAALSRAEAALKLTEAQRLDILRKEQDLTARRADVDRSKANLSVIDSQMDDTQVSAPADGIVLLKSADPGEVLAAGTPILTIGEIDKPWLRGYVPQTKLGRIQLGMPVSIRSDSFPGKTYNGKISFIASEAEFTPKQIQTQEERVKLVYRIKIEIDNARRELKLNMPVDAEIRLN
jgi:HlyD family secretion protein